MARSPDEAGWTPTRRATAGALTAVTALVVGAIWFSADDSASDPPRAGSSTTSSDNRVTSIPARTADAPTPVGPAPGMPLHGIDRDSGVSVRLRDGSVLWLFGDSAGFDANGAMTYFVIGTAAWAPADNPLVTEEFASDGEPVVAGSPSPASPPCDRSAPVPGLWPMSAVVQPFGELDRVVVWFENICLGSGVAGYSTGMAVGEWFYHPADPPSGRPINIPIMNPQLFPDRGLGMASVLGDDGRVYTYGCLARPGGGGPDAYGPCHVARVSLDAVAFSAAYEVWTGNDWAPYGAPRAPLELPAGTDAAPIPPGMLSVIRSPDRSSYVMAYSPWPASSAQLEIRTSPSPEGPWSPPTSVELPGCEDVEQDPTRGCYAGSVQSFLTTEDSLGIGWYDRVIQTAPRKGNYMVSTVPWG